MLEKLSFQFQAAAHEQSLIRFAAFRNPECKIPEHGESGYSYDKSGRLLNANNASPEDEAQTHAVGNRLTDAKTTGTWSYTNSDELESYDAVTLTYDANGSLTQKNDNGTITQYLYNLENRLAEVRDGAVVWAAKYEAFGVTYTDVGEVENLLRFPGQYFDGETGLHYNYFRDYEPTTGRYVESDPVGLVGWIPESLHGSFGPGNY